MASNLRGMPGAKDAAVTKLGWEMMGNAQSENNRRTEDCEHGWTTAGARRTQSHPRDHDEREREILFSFSFSCSTAGNEEIPREVGNQQSVTQSWAHPELSILSSSSIDVEITCIQSIFQEVYTVGQGVREEESQKTAHSLLCVLRARGSGPRCAREWAGVSAVARSTQNIWETQFTTSRSVINPCGRERFGVRHRPASQRRARTTYLCSLRIRLECGCRQ